MLSWLKFREHLENELVWTRKIYFIIRRVPDATSGYQGTHFVSTIISGCKVAHSPSQRIIKHCSHNTSNDLGFPAVQEERQKNKESSAPDSNENEEPDSTYLNMPVEQIMQAELAVEPKQEKYIDATSDAVANICQVQL